MTVRFHKFVQRDVNSILKHYYSISDELAEAFWSEFNLYLSKIEENSQRYGFWKSTKFRRANLGQFPYLILYEDYPGLARILVVRHENRHPDYGLKRKF